MRLDPAPLDPLALARHRVHEAEGRGRRAFALFQAARHPGPLVWISPAHQAEFPLPAGLPLGLSDRLHLLRPKGETDLLWAVEECLRSRAVGLVIAEPSDPLSLTVGRRLQLAAEAGRSTGLMLIREGAGSNATETRWACTPLANLCLPGPTADSTLHHWSLIKNKNGTLVNWTVNWNGTTAAVHMVSQTGERCQPAEPAC